MQTTQRDPSERRRTARVLSGATEAELAELWRTWPERPEVEYLRGPEAGLVMVQARTGGAGDRFHLGEATVTRATVAVRGAGDEAVGTAYVLGSHPEHAALAAIFDAMLGSGARERVLAGVIEPLERAQHERDLRARRDARATVVDFFTVARENDGSDDEDDE
ncbi:phosphonate C-P lyase system protein PhnG [Microbacterium sediminis]|uniref:Phosphonate C-P lyase system protein PhnG n=1 Tax=Microbacterium sediminis TaxID=904291 RepID=A0A1B9N8C2_9MICO|nr:phosphonate C-P lyase system protein PhnG [Microbacterium sediminis]OCG72849.1 phosphonate C-P lyase system protein PhnG [Microbacterium sediminis]QBR73474.1 phosphonate C-P lyase system protein PhnG [Microbacterium sediminis]